MAKPMMNAELPPSEPYETIGTEQEDIEGIDFDELVNELTQDLSGDYVNIDTFRLESLKSDEGEQETVNKAALNFLRATIGDIIGKYNSQKEECHKLRKCVIQKNRLIESLRQAMENYKKLHVASNDVNDVTMSSNNDANEGPLLCVWKPRVLSVSSQTDESVPTVLSVNSHTDAKKINFVQPSTVMSNQGSKPEPSEVPEPGRDSSLDAPATTDVATSQPPVPSPCTEDSDFSLIDVSRGEDTTPVHSSIFGATDLYPKRTKNLSEVLTKDCCKLAQEKVIELQKECENFKQELKEVHAKLKALKSNVKGHRPHAGVTTPPRFPIQQALSNLARVSSSSLPPKGNVPAAIQSSETHQPVQRSSTLPATIPRLSSNAVYEMQANMFRRIADGRSLDDEIEDDSQDQPRLAVLSESKRRSRSEKTYPPEDRGDEDDMSLGTLGEGPGKTDLITDPNAESKNLHRTLEPTDTPTMVPFKNYGGASAAVPSKRVSVTETKDAVQESLTPPPLGDYVCPVCKRDFSYMTLDVFQLHVFECADKNDVSRLPSNYPPLVRTCPVCTLAFPTASQRDFEKHVDDHFYNTPSASGYS